MLHSVGLDVGTTGLKGIRVDERGSVVATTFDGYDVQRRHAGWYLPEQCFYPVNFLIDDAPPFDAARLRERGIGDALGKRSRHTYLSDNFGDLDAHLIPGECDFNFAGAFASLKARLARTRP